MALVLSSETRHQTRRSAFEVRMDILRVAAGGSCKPTHIMYRSNTSWIVLQKNLESLLGAGFMRLSEERSKTEYVITEKGSAVLHDYVNLVERATEAPKEVAW